MMPLDGVGNHIVSARTCADENVLSLVDKLCINKGQTLMLSRGLFLAFLQKCKSGA